MKKINYNTVFISFGLFLSLSFFIFPNITQATNHYVQTAASGSNNGIDWTNAWTGFSSINWDLIQPGDVLYISGDYSNSLLVQKSGTMSEPITIRVATLEDHGTNIGWESSLSSRSFINNASVDLRDRSNIIFDGNNNLLISANQEFPSSSGALVYIGSDSISENITIEKMEIIGQGELTCLDIRGIGIYGLDSRVNNLTIDNVIIHEFSGAAVRLGNHNGVLIKDCDIYNIQNASEEYCFNETGIHNNNPHNTHIALYGDSEINNVTIRNNNIYQDYDDNIVDGGYAIGFGYTAMNVDIFNNIFFNVNNPILGTENPVPVSEGRINFYSNTVVGSRTISLPAGSSMNISNNIFCNNGFDSAYTRYAYSEDLTVDDYNNMFCYDSRYQYPYGENGSALASNEDPFVDISEKNFYLKDVSYANLGRDLGAVYAFDFENTIRPQGSAWDIGAYEYVEAEDITAPQFPINLQVL